MGALKPVYAPAVVEAVERFGGLAWIRLGVTLDPPPRPAQFVMVVVHGVEAVPMSVAWRDDAGVELIVRPVGDTTRILYGVERGARLGIIGPLGRSADSVMRDTAGRRILLLGGGSGVAPVLYMASWFQRRGAIVDVKLGFRDAREAGIRRIFELHGVSVEVWCEEYGDNCDREGMVVGPHLPTREYDVVVAAGPLAMLREAYRLFGGKLYVVLEAIVKCGLGFCGSCRLWPGGPLLCRDGPVFRADSVARLLA